MPMFSQFQAALERCMSAEPPKEFALSPDSSTLADVYAEMLYLGEKERALDKLTQKQREAFSRWEIRS